MDGGRRVGKEREGWVETRGRRPGKKVLVSTVNSCIFFLGHLSWNRMPVTEGKKRDGMR